MKFIVLVILFFNVNSLAAQDAFSTIEIGKNFPKSFKLNGYTMDSSRCCQFARFNKQVINLSVLTDSSSTNTHTIIIFYDSLNTIYGAIEKIVCNNSDESILNYGTFYKELRNAQQDKFIPNENIVIRDGKDNGFDGVYYFTIKDDVNSTKNSIGVIENIFYREKYAIESPYLPRLIN